MMWAAVIGTVVSAAVSAYAQYSASQAQAQAADYNRKVTRQQAETARQVAGAHAESASDRYRRILGAQRARAAASGVISSEGSPLLVLMESEEQAALDVARIRWGGAAQAQGLEAEARLQRFYAQTARRQGTLAASATLLGGVAKAGSIYAASKSGGGEWGATQDYSYQTYRRGER